MNGELQGGLDVVKEMIEDEGSLVAACEIVATNDRITSIIASHQVVLFMKVSKSKSDAVSKCS